MDQNVTTRPNYYQMLGLEPAASAAEIERAFAQQVSAFTPRAFGSVALLSIAFETLHDPAKRRAYDQSIGLPPPPPLRTLAVRASGTLSFIGSGETASRLAHLAPIAPRPDPVAEPAPETPAPPLDAIEAEALAEEARREARIGAFLAESQRIADVQPLAARDEEKAAPLPEPAEDTRPMARPLITAPVATMTFDPDAYADTGVGTKNLRIIALGAGAMVVVAALLGAWAGLDANDRTAVAVPDTAPRVNVTLPPAEAAETAELPALAASDAPPGATRPRMQANRRVPVVPAPAAPVDDLASSAGAEEGRVSRLSLIENSLPVAGEAAPAAEPVTTAPAVASEARMPLGNATIASTLRKIGYPCGSVASTAAGSGAGVYVVTCTSGDSYRASPNRGRYRFKKI